MARSTILFFCLANLIIWSTLGVAQVQVITLDNKIEKGEVVGLEQNPVAQVVLKTILATKKIRCDDIVEIICFNPKKLKTLPTTVMLGDGSLLYGNIIDGNQKHIYLESLSFGTIRIDLTKIKEIRLVAGLPALKKRDSENDVLYFKSGDVMKCLIDSFSKGYVQVQHQQLGIRKEYFEKLQRITFAQLESIDKIPQRLSTTIVGTDSSRLTGKLLKLNHNSLTLKLPQLEMQINMPLNHVQHFFFQGGKFVYLSDLSKRRYRINYIPYFPGPTDWFLPKLDHNQEGGPIYLQKHWFYKGIGVISRTEITVQLNKEFQKFQSHIGIDDIVRERLHNSAQLIGGSVVFQVSVDGLKKYDSGVMHWSDNSMMIEVDVAGKNEMKLVVDFADNAHVNDFANWGGARLVKK